MDGMTRFQQAYSSRLKMEREKRKLTQVQVADMIEVSRPRYNKWETGKGLPSLDRAYAIWTLFGIDFNELEHLMNLYEQIDGR